MMRSAGVRFLVVGVLALLMFIPLLLVADVIDSRARYSRDTIREISQDWGGAQALYSVSLVVPVTELVTTKSRVPVVDTATDQPRLNALGGQIMTVEEEVSTQTRAPVYLAPGTFAAKVTTRSEIRHRGIFDVPVYMADAVLNFDFDPALAETQIRENQTLHWDKAEVQLTLATNRALRRNAELTVDGKPLILEPFLPEARNQGGIKAVVGDPRALKGYRMVLGFNGAQTLRIGTMGRESQIDMTSDWPHPSFSDTFLPDAKTVTDTGFTAHWQIPSLASAIAQVSRTPPENAPTVAVDFFQPNDFYQKAFRAGKYGILFIALTFLTVMLVENRAKRPAHPVQYILIGIAQSMFVLLMVAFAEQIGFGAAYALSSAATTTLIAAYGATGMRLGKGALVLGAMLMVLYGVLFLILRSADYALLAGSCLAFLALAATMYGTRNEDWYGPERPGGGGWLRRAPRPAAPAVPPTA